MYIHRSLRDRFTQIELPGLQVRDCVLIEISMNRKEKVLVGCIYHHSDNSDKENEDLFCILRNLAHRRHEVLIAGDFNLPRIDWSSWTTPTDHTSTEFKFIEYILDCYMHQHITSPTRGRGTDQPSILDLVLTDDVNCLDDIEITSPLGKSDHSMISMDLKYVFTRHHTSKITFQYNRGDNENTKKGFEC